MSHRHVGFTDVPPAVIQAHLVQAGVRISFRTDEEPRGVLSDGEPDKTVRWLWLPGGQGGKIRWGITTTPRKDHPEDNGARVFLQGKASSLAAAEQLILQAIRDANPGAIASGSTGGDAPAGVPE